MPLRVGGICNRKLKGPLMPHKPCSICIHPQASEINEMLQQKQSTAREIAEAYNLKLRQLENHRRLHLGVVHRRLKKAAQSTVRSAVRSEVQSGAQKVVIVNRGVAASLRNQRPQPTFGAVPASAMNIRELTIVQRDRIRHALDKTFDGEKGAYVEGYSDQRIGTETDIPWRAVYNIRELAYGPIREHPLTPDFTAFDHRLSEIETTVKQLRTEFDTLHRKLIGVNR